VQQAQRHIGEGDRSWVPVWTTFAAVILITIAVGTMLFVWLNGRSGSKGVESVPLVVTPATTLPAGGIDLGASAPAATAQVVSTPTITFLLEVTPTHTIAPSHTSSRTPAVNKTTPSVVRYGVKPGDTLTAIAAEYHVSIQAIVDANRLRNDTIYVGQELIIPVTASKP
jgi:LysM repeat protein